MAGRDKEGSSVVWGAVGGVVSRRDQMPAMGQRSSPVRTKWRVSEKMRSADGVGPKMRVRFMGFSFLRRWRRVGVVYPPRV